MPNHRETKIHDAEFEIGRNCLRELANLGEDDGRSVIDPEQYHEPGPHYQDFDCNLSGADLDAKLLAFYLPQFYSFDLNDKWWGKGFTEWRNVVRSRPRFDGHYQPRIPRDLGFYDLRESHTLYRQAELARTAGIYGWCFYYYDLFPQRLLDRPVNNFLNSPDIDINFCLMWANESWSRTWNEGEGQVLVKNTLDKSHDEKFIDGIAEHFVDPRYIRVDGRPLFIIYHPKEIPDAKGRIDQWRELLFQRHRIEAVWMMCQSHWDSDPTPYGLDGAVEFPPHNAYRSSDSIVEQLGNVNTNFSGKIARYETLVRNNLSRPSKQYPRIKGVATDWDNEPRKPNSGTGFIGSTPDKYRVWLEAAIRLAQLNPLGGESFVTINAWNEWAEGAYLEPDLFYGSAYLNATAKALQNVSRVNG